MQCEKLLVMRTAVLRNPGFLHYMAPSKRQCHNQICLFTNTANTFVAAVS